MRDLVAFDHLQQFFRIETRFEDDIGTDAEGIKSVGIGRRMIHRPGDDGHHLLRLAIGGVEAHHLADDGGPGHRLLGRRRRPAHAFGMAGRARGVDHRAGRLGGAGRDGLELLEPAAPVLGAGRQRGGFRRYAVGGHDLGRCRDEEDGHVLRDCPFDAAIEIGMDDDRLGARILEDVARLVGRIVPVDRRRIGADQTGGDGGLEKGKVVPEIDRNDIARADAETAEAARRLRRPQRQRRMIHHARARPHHRFAHRRLPG